MQDFVVKYDKLIRLFGWLIVGLTLWWWYDIITSAHSIFETIARIIGVVMMGGVLVPIFIGIHEWYVGYSFSTHRRPNSKYMVYNDVKNKILNEEIQKRKGKDVKITNKIIRDVIKDIGKDELENRIEDVIKRFGGYESLEKNSPRYSEASQKLDTSSTKRSGYSSRNSDFSNSSDINYHHSGDSFDGGGHHHSGDSFHHDVTDYF